MNEQLFSPAGLASQSFCERGRNKSSISELSQTGLYENETFLKTSISGEFNFIERPKKSLTLTAPKSLVFNFEDIILHT